MYERRDIRSRFLPDPIPPTLLGRILGAAHHSPSVGFMQPWDFMAIDDAAVRQAIHQGFLETNRRAAEQDDRAPSLATA